MKLIADRQLTGEYGTVTPGQEFEVRDEIGTDLLRRNLVRTAAPPRVEYDTKVIRPAEAPEVGARETPFRHVPVPDEEPENLAEESRRVLSGADLSEAGTHDPGGRRGRARSSAAR